MLSESAAFLYAAKKAGIIKSNTHFWRNFCGYRIVSGLAASCDTAAHMTCLACGGKTITVLPSTHSNFYPKENASLAEHIVQNGGLVRTEYITESATRYDRI